MECTKSKINMKHGFMKSIIRNQVDRDNYDREVKARLQDEKAAKKAARHRKPDLQTYIPPVNRGKHSDEDDSDVQTELLKVEYEDQNGHVSELIIQKGDDPAALAEEFGASHSLTPPLVSALKKMVLQEMALTKS